MATKTEGGHTFPMEAYARVGDKARPDTWAVRIWESDRPTLKQLAVAAGTFTESGVRADKLGAVRKKLAREYAKLGVAPEQMPVSVREEVAVMVQGDLIPITEAAAGDGEGVAEVCVIEAGFNKSGRRYYPAEMLKRDHRVFEGAQMYADHSTRTEQRERPERSVRDLVGVVKNVRVAENGAVFATPVLFDPALKGKLAQMKEHGVLASMGVSHHSAAGSVKNKSIDGRRTTVIESLKRCFSVDFVTQAGAGGGVLCYESDDPYEGLTLRDLEINRPDLFEAATTNGGSVMDLETQVRELTAQVASLTEAHKGTETQLAEAVTAKEAAETKLAEADKATKAAEAQAVIEKAITEAELPDAAKDHLRESWKDRDSAEGITEAVTAHRTYLVKLSEGHKVTGLGGGGGAPTQSVEEARKELFESSKARYIGEGRTDEEATRMAQAYAK